MSRTVVRTARVYRAPGPIECGVIAGLVAASAIFSTRFYGDEVAVFLFRLTLAG